VLRTMRTGRALRSDPFVAQAVRGPGISVSGDETLQGIADLPGRSTEVRAWSRRQKTQIARITMMTSANARIAIVRVFTGPP
jgi:hypothetical protein